MSEVIEDYIRRNTGMSEDAAFEGFLQQDRIRAWVGVDQSRRDRLRREFSRVWESLHPPSTTSRQGTLVREAKQPIQVEVRREAPPQAQAPEPRPQPRLNTGAARHLQVMCPVCRRLDVWLADGVIACRHCGRSYDDMLHLIPVKPVGPFEYVFGGGWKGVAKAAGVAAGLVLVYIALRW